MTGATSDAAKVAELEKLLAEANSKLGGGQVVFHPGRFAHEAAWVSTLMLIAFMALVPFLRNIIGSAAMAWLADSIWFFLLVYLNVQFWETSSRNPTAVKEYFVDNSLALGGVVVGIILMVLPWFWQKPGEEWSLIIQCTLFGLSDLMWGLLVSQRIAFAGKERDEA
jgi:hypothetical protein